jgi:hypothetical protein
MKDEQREQARNLYFQGGLSKTDIGKLLNVSRRTIYQWSVEGNWDNLKKSAQHMPVILAEKCYYLIGHLTDHILRRDYDTVTKPEVDMLHKLALTIGKLKHGSTVSESMQSFTFFLERVQSKDPALAKQMLPHVEEYISARRDVSETSFLLQGFDKNGYLPFPEEEMIEKWQDEKDDAALVAEFQANNPPPPAEPSTEESDTPIPPTPAAPSSTPHQTNEEKTHTQEEPSAHATNKVKGFIALKFSPFRRSRSPHPHAA